MFEDLAKEPQRERSPFGLTSIPGFLAGLVFARYTSPYGYLPIAAVLLLAFAGKRFLPESRQRAVFALAVQAGYLAWLAVAFVATRSLTVLPDIVILGGVLLWFALAPSRISAIAVAAVYGIFLVIGVRQIVDVPFGSQEHRALMVHFVLRLSCIALAAHYVWLLRTRPSPDLAAEAAPPPGA